MKSGSLQRVFPSVSKSLFLAAISFSWNSMAASAAESEDWRSIPLISDGKVDDSWAFTGYGKFVVDDGTIRTEPDPKGLGLLFYRKEKLGNCQIRVVFKTKEAKSNSGVYVRIADGILDQAGKPGAAFDRDATGKPSSSSLEEMKVSADREEGPWFAVHRGYEVQIVDVGNTLHRTGSIYSLAPSSNISKKQPGEWKTMVITLTGSRILVDLDDQRITTFDSEKAERSGERQWFEPKLEQKRPESGYIGLQTHDPGEIVWFKEVSVRKLPTAAAK
jgi:hypothetical protein